MQPDVPDSKDLELLISVLQVQQQMLKNGRQPRFLYLPPGGIRRLADKLKFVNEQQPGKDAWLAGMVLIERPLPPGMSATIQASPLPDS